MSTEEKEKVVYVILHETVLSSWLKDFGSIGAAVLAVIANHQLAGGSGWLDFTICVMLLAFIFGSLSQASKGTHRLTRERLIEKLNEGWRGDER